MRSSFIEAGSSIPFLPPVLDYKFPKWRNLNLCSKPKSLTLFMRIVNTSVFCRAVPGFSLSIWGLQSSDFHAKGGITVYSLNSICKINTYQTYKLNRNTHLISSQSCSCQCVLLSVCVSPGTLHYSNRKCKIRFLPHHENK